MVFDAKGGEIVHKDKIGLTKGTKGREVTKERGQLKFKYTSRGSKLINLNGAFECAFHMYACIIVVGLIDEMKN